MLHLGGCDGLERTHFKQFLLWEGVVVLKKLIFNSCSGVVVLKKLILIVLHLGGSGGLERTHFKQCLLWEGVVVLKELILNSFYFGSVCCS